MKNALIGAKLFTGEEFFENKALLIEGTNIAGIVNVKDVPKEFKIQKLNGGILSPGFIDLQVNGGGGKLFNNSRDNEGLNTIIEAHQYFGSTSIMPTVISDSLNILQQCADTVSNEIKKNHSLLGLHIEGPFFSEKYRGIHQKQYINTINASYLSLFEKLDKFPVMLTLAPECISIKQLKHLKSLGFKILAGHTDASYDQLEEAIKYGLDGFTHLFNAMGQISAREPSVVGSAFDFDETSASIIVDLCHVHPSLIRLSFKQKPKGKLFFVSDSMATINHGEPTFELYDEIVSESNGRIINSEGKLAGSSITQIDAIKNAYQKCNIPLESAIAMATLYPAQYLGVSHYIGQLKQGYRADLAHFDSSFQVRNVWLAGKQIKKDTV